MEKKRGSFTDKLGFVLAAAGSAVGLGNLWRFPYLAAKYGGGIFLFVYLILAVTFGFALMVTEIALGRKTRLSAIGAYPALDKRFKFLGYLSSVIPFLITPYYCVIGGWVLKYLVVFLTGQVSSAAGDEFFSSYIAQPGAPVDLLCDLCDSWNAGRTSGRRRRNRKGKPFYDAGSGCNDSIYLSIQPDAAGSYGRN